jgi:hypothetical protein
VKNKDRHKYTKKENGAKERLKQIKRQRTVGNHERIEGFMLCGICTFD